MVKLGTLDGVCTLPGSTVFPLYLWPAPQPFPFPLGSKYTFSLAKYDQDLPFPDPVFSTELDPCVGVLSVRGYFVFPGRSCGRALLGLYLPLPLPAAGGAVASAVPLPVVGIGARLSRLFPLVRRTSSTSLSRSSVSV